MELILKLEVVRKKVLRFHTTKINQNYKFYVQIFTFYNVRSLNGPNNKEISHFLSNISDIL